MKLTIKPMAIMLSFILALTLIPVHTVYAASSKKNYTKTCHATLTAYSHNISVGIQDKRVAYFEDGKLYKEVYVPGPFETVYLDGMFNPTTYEYRYVTIKGSARSYAFNDAENTFVMKTIFKAYSRDGTLLDKAPCKNVFVAKTSNPYIYIPKDDEVVEV